MFAIIASVWLRAVWPNTESRYYHVLLPKFFLPFPTCFWMLDRWWPFTSSFLFLIIAPLITPFISALLCVIFVSMLVFFSAFLAIWPAYLFPSIPTRAGTHKNNLLDLLNMLILNMLCRISYNTSCLDVDLPLNKLGRRRIRVRASDCSEWLNFLHPMQRHQKPLSVMCQGLSIHL